MTPARRWGALLALAVVLVWGAAAPAAAHAELVGTDPVEGAVLPEAPDVVRFTFSEPVRGVPDGVQVFDADGEPVASSARTRDQHLLVTLDDEVGNGSLVVAWRVVSADGHPISGTLTFAVGAPSPTVRAPDVDEQDDLPVALSLSRWPAYVGLFLAVGLVWFATLLLPRGLDPTDRSWLRLRLMARLSAVVAAVGWLAGVPLTALYLRGSGLDSLAESATWRALPLEEVALTGCTVVAVLTTAWLLGPRPARSSRHRVAGLAGLWALAPLPLSGHTRAEDEAVLVVAVDGLHLVAGATWLGGLVGLAVTLPALAARGETRAETVTRFSSAAAATLAGLILTGAFLTWRIVGSWSGLIDNGYGQVLMAKLSLAGVAATIAAHNRFRLLPRVRGAAGFPDRVASSRSLSRTARFEAAVLVAVLLLTGFLVQKSPPRESLATPAAGAQTVRADLGDLDAFVTLSPAGPGMNTVTLRLRDADGEPAEGTELPRVRITSGDLAGDVPLAEAGPGTFEGRIVLPRGGVWQVQVSVRLSQFDNPVATVDIEVGGP